MHPLPPTFRSQVQAGIAHGHGLAPCAAFPLNMNGTTYNKTVMRQSLDFRKVFRRMGIWSILLRYYRREAWRSEFSSLCSARPQFLDEW